MSDLIQGLEWTDANTLTLVKIDVQPTHVLVSTRADQCSSRTLQSDHDETEAPIGKCKFSYIFYYKITETADSRSAI